MSSSITLPFSEQSRSDPSEPGPASFSRHPTRDWPPSQIARHVVAVHHANLRDSLGELQASRPRIARFAPLRGSQWGLILRQFVKLHDALLSSLEWEASEVFPQLLRWHEDGRQQPRPDELLAAVKIVERSHAWCLHMLWRLLRLTRDEIPSTACANDQRHFLTHLIALGSEYEQHLFEVECLLLPVIKTGLNQPQPAAATSMSH